MMHLVLLVSALATALLQVPPSSRGVVSDSAAASDAQNSPSSVPYWALGISAASLLISAAAGYFQFRAHRAKKPVISITMDGLPPYESQQAKTEVRVKNVGSASTTRRLDVTVHCSWMPLLSYRLNFPTETYCLEPEEEHWWRFRMNDNLVPNSLVKVTVWDADRDHSTAYEHLNTPTSVAATVQGSGTPSSAPAEPASPSAGDERRP